MPGDRSGFTISKGKSDRAAASHRPSTSPPFGALSTSALKLGLRMARVAAGLPAATPPPLGRTEPGHLPLAASRKRKAGAEALENLRGGFAAPPAACAPKTAPSSPRKTAQRRSSPRLPHGLLFTSNPSAAPYYESGTRRLLPNRRGLQITAHSTPSLPPESFCQSQGRSRIHRAMATVRSRKQKAGKETDL